MGVFWSIVLFWSPLLWQFSSPLQYGTGRLEMLEEKVFRELLQDYDKSVRPATLVSRTTVVTHGLSILRLVDLKGNTMTVDVWEDMEWIDPRLRWNPADRDDVDRVNIASSLLWVPDVVLYNSAGSSTDTYPSTPRQAFVSHDGTVYTSSASRLVVLCGTADGCPPIDQRGIFSCNLKFGSWGYDGFRLDLRNRTDGIDLTNIFIQSKWRVTNSSATRNEVFYSCCPEPFPDVTYTIQLAPKYRPCELL
ncbi:acetylcholine receptor subunit alpha-like 1 [Ylistrum balloti]|uniref:acetylcholine receptor subunit alpha-like 1 n=1 Tax=Ylistrum balloti TaxID=509963 RepID=UPI002905A854|nr:acetylcholine receptor subunit alpha-like 1 [Ylistrum balloti]